MYNQDYRDQYTQRNSLELKPICRMAALTDAEAAVYDRQIRVWGVETQKRCSAWQAMHLRSSCRPPGHSACMRSKDCKRVMSAG